MPSGKRAGLVFVVVGCAVGTACGVEESTKCPAPTTAGTATDEVPLVFQDAKEFAKDDPAGPQVSSPLADQTFAKDGDAPTFSWSDELAVVTPRLPRTFAPQAPRSPKTPGFFESLSHLVIGTAWAHLPPVSGGMYLVGVTLPDDECPVATVTSDLSLVVDDPLWKRLQDSDGPFTFDLKSAYFIEGRILEGPYQTTRSFTVE